MLTKLPFIYQKVVMPFSLARTVPATTLGRVHIKTKGIAELRDVWA